MIEINSLQVAELWRLAEAHPGPIKLIQKKECKQLGHVKAVFMETGEHYNIYDDRAVYLGTYDTDYLI